MTAKEAGALMKRLVSAFPRSTVPDATVATYVRYLLPLPTEVVEPRIDLLLMGHHRSDRDQPFFPEVNDVLAGLGITGGALVHLGTAMREGGTLEPSLRDASGWEHVLPDGPIPLGVAEAILVSGGRLPAGRQVALPERTEPPDPAAVEMALGAILAQRKRTALQRAFQRPGFAPGPGAPLETEVSLDDERIPPAALRLIDALETERRALERARVDLEEELSAQRAAHRAEVEAGLVGAASSAAALELVERLVAQLVADPLVGLESTVEAVRRGMVPRLATRVLRPVLAPPSLVDLEGLDGPPERRPIEGLTIVFADERSS